MSRLVLGTCLLFASIAAQAAAPAFTVGIPTNCASSLPLDVSFDATFPPEVSFLLDETSCLEANSVKIGDKEFHGAGGVVSTSGDTLIMAGRVEGTIKIRLKVINPESFCNQSSPPELFFINKGPSGGAVKIRFVPSESITSHTEKSDLIDIITMVRERYKDVFSYHFGPDSAWLIDYTAMRKNPEAKTDPRFCRDCDWLAFARFVDFFSEYLLTFDSNSGSELESLAKLPVLALSIESPEQIKVVDLDGTSSVTFKRVKDLLGKSAPRLELNTITPPKGE